MVVTIEISDKDIETLMNTPMTIEEMENTIEGRIACAICRSVNKEASDG